MKIAYTIMYYRKVLSKGTTLVLVKMLTKMDDVGEV